MGKIRVILLGTTHPHIFHRYNYFASRPDIQVIGYYEDNEEIAVRMKPHTGCLRFERIADLLALPCDAAVIHGYDRENAFYIQQAIEAGVKGIFVEKPGVGQPAEFFPLAQEIAKKGIVFEVGWELHYTEPVKLARRIVRENVLGSITSARFHGGCPGGAGAELWQSDPANIGGFFYSLGGHTIETIVDLFGVPRRTVSSIRKLPLQPSHTGFSWMPDLFEAPKRGPKTAVGGLVHEDVGSAILEYDSFNVTIDMTGWEPNRYCEEWAMDIYGTGGALHLVPDPPSGSLLLMEDTGPWKRGKQVLFADENEASQLEHAFRKQMTAFFDRIVGKKVEDLACDEKVLVPLLRLYQAMYKSAASDSWEIV